MSCAIFINVMKRSWKV